MSVGLDRFALDRIIWGGFGSTGVGLPQSSEQQSSRARFFKTRLLLLPLPLVAAVGVWLVMSGSRGGIAESELSGDPVAAVAPAPPADQAPREVAYDPFTSEAIAPEQPTPLDRMKLYAQYWRRGGLGSNAQVSFTLRNGNDYAVKNVEIACTFIRRDGRHLTDRTRLVPGIIERRSRKSFEFLHIGFVNVNASKAKCTLVSAART